MADFLEPSTSGTIEGNDTHVLDVVGLLGGSRTSNTLYCWGNFDNGSISVEITPDGDNWFPYADKIVSDNFFTFSGRFLACRLQMTGAGVGVSVEYIIL